MPKFLTTFLLAFIFLQGVKAQDANYWSNSYNPGGYLTPGAVIAFNRDSGVMFLNPALLAYNNKSTASISGSVYQYGNIKIKNGVGTGLDLKSTTASIVPQLASGTIAIKGSHPFTVGYALTHNPLLTFRSNQQRDARFNVLDDSYSPGDEYFLGQYSNQNIINETSGIISGGFKVSDKVAVGLTMEGQFRKQDFNYSATQRALYNTPANASLPPYANVEDSYQASYYHAGVRFKAGLAYDVDKHHFGLTLSAPTLSIKGNGSLLSDNEVADLKMPAEGDTVNLLTNARQQSLKVKYKTPLSAGFGYSYDLKRGQVYFAAEYFTRVSEYNVITPRDESFIKGDFENDGLAPSILKFKDARNAIFNFGVGVSYQLQPEVMGFMSVHTDFSYADNVKYRDTEGYKTNTANYNIYHCQLGANLKKRKFNLRAGLLLSYGTTNKYTQPVNYDNPNEANYLEGNVGNARATQYSVGLMLAYIHNL
jgi:hypothetical protein